jgi:hypothetical protein
MKENEMGDVRYSGGAVGSMQGLAAETSEKETQDTTRRRWEDIIEMILMNRVGAVEWILLDYVRNKWRAVNLYSINAGNFVKLLVNKNSVSFFFFNLII